MARETTRPCSVLPPAPSRGAQHPVHARSHTPAQHTALLCGDVRGPRAVARLGRPAHGSCDARPTSHRTRPVPTQRPATDVRGSTHCVTCAVRCNQALQPGVATRCGNQARLLTQAPGLLHPTSRKHYKLDRGSPAAGGFVYEHHHDRSRAIDDATPPRSQHPTISSRAPALQPSFFSHAPTPSSSLPTQPRCLCAVARAALP